MTNKDITNSRSNGLPQTQRAAQYSSKTNSVSVNTTPLPTPSKDQLLIKVASASLCHSDLMLLEPNETGLLLGDGRPITIGHEATGIIISVPDTCTDPRLKVGARVGFLCPEDVCYECYGCQIHNNVRTPLKYKVFLSDLIARQFCNSCMTICILTRHFCECPA